MDKIEVESRVNQGGEAVPFSFKMGGISYQVDGIGRRWVETDGEHMLVMVKPNNRVFELLYIEDVETWWLVKEHRSPKRHKA